MYGRTLGGKVLEFGHEGVLYENSFIMYDKETESLWLHVTGEALKGPLKGEQLSFIPSEVVPWGEWRLRHPATKVLLGAKARGMMGTFALRDRTTEFGLSVGQGRDVVLFPFPDLERAPLLHHGDGEAGMLVVYAPDSGRAVAYRSLHEGQPLRFELLTEETAQSDESGGSAEAPAVPAKMRDLQTGSTWDRMRGECLSGRLAGARLPRIPATPWLVSRWKGFFPDGKIVRLQEQAGG